jgi:hypothetical protein
VNTRCFRLFDANLEQQKASNKSETSATTSIKAKNQIRNTQMSGRLTALAMNLPGGWTFVFKEALLLKEWLPNVEGM